MRSTGWAAVRHAEIDARTKYHLYRCAWCNCHGMPIENQDPVAVPLVKCEYCTRRFCPRHIAAEDHHCRFKEEEDRRNDD